MKAPRAVLFDAGLTLVQSATPAEGVAAEVVARQDLTSEVDLAAAMTQAQASLEARWHREDWWGSEERVRALFVSAYLEGLKESGLEPDAAETLAHGIYDAYQDTRHWTTYADVLPTLDLLRDTGVHMGIISDWGHGLEAIILELELAHYFEFVVISSRIGISKPDPQVFNMALDRIGVSPETAFYVGDTYVKDVLGARAAGVTPILLDRHGHAPPVDCLRIASLAELPEIVGLT